MRRRFPGCLSGARAWAGEAGRATWTTFELVRAGRVVIRSSPIRAARQSSAEGHSQDARHQLARRRRGRLCAGVPCTTGAEHDLPRPANDRTSRDLAGKRRARWTCPVMPSNLAGSDRRQCARPRCVWPVPEHVRTPEHGDGMYAPAAIPLRRCTARRVDGRPCRAWAAWDDPHQRCNAHAVRTRGPKRPLPANWIMATLVRRSTPQPCRCTAYPWPHRAAGGRCHWPDTRTEIGSSHRHDAVSMQG